MRRTDSGDALADARPQDLVEILDGLNRRADELTAEIADLERTLAALRSRRRVVAGRAGGGPPAGRDAGDAGRHRTGDRAGRHHRHRRPERDGVTPEVLLAAMQELRNAGAEAIQVNGVRIGVDSYFSGVGGAIVADGVGVDRAVHDRRDRRPADPDRGDADPGRGRATPSAGPAAR